MNDIVRYLHNEFLERCRKNERYSLRAFAKSLGMPPSSVSEIINGKRQMTKKLRDKLGLALNLSPDEIIKFKAKNHGNSQEQTTESSEINYQQLALDSFYLISEWYHYGILQLIKTKGFKNDPKWLAKRLGINVMQVKLAIIRLKRLGIIEASKDGSLNDATHGSTSHIRDNFTSDELRSFQIKALEKAMQSLKSVPLKYRDNTTMTLAMSKEAIPFAKEEIKKFRRKLTKQLEAFAEPDEVYQMAISLTPLTEIVD